MEYVARFFIGGIVVSLFAFLGEILRPKSFAGLLGAAPSVALSTLALTTIWQGAEEAKVQSFSMIWGAIALLVYCVFVFVILWKFKINALLLTFAGLGVWLAIAFGFHMLSGVME